MDNKVEYISKNIKSYRARMGYSQREVAEILGVSRNTYCDYEVRPQKVNVETLMKIANILKCELSDFFVEFDVAKSNE